MGAVSVLESLVDFGIVSFGVYNSCYIDNLFGTIGSMTSGSGMSADYLVNVGMDFLAAFQGNVEESKSLNLQNVLKATNINAGEYTDVGRATGELLSEIFDYHVPVYVYDEYEKAETN